MCFVLKCILIIYILKTSQVLASKNQIDDFIEKLLASKKFDKLAEKLAQKAVERMFDLKPNLRFSKDFATQINEPEKIAFKNISYKTDVHFRETVSPLKNLSLKFKYFTKGPVYNLHSKDSRNTDVKEPDEPITKNLADTEPKAGDDDDRSINISDLEGILQDNDENTSVTVPHNIYGEIDRTLSQNNTMNEHESDGSISVENKKNAELFSENELPEDHKANESHSTVVVSDFDNNVRKDRALFSDASKETSKKIRLKTPRKKRIHREGNRLYTFQSSSDYEEYHQELERVEKERKVFV